MTVRSDGEQNDEKQKDQTVERHEDLTWKTPPMRRVKTTGAIQQELHYIGCVFKTPNDVLQEK